MIDFHSHLLPQIDDGSQSLEESLGMLKMEYEQGVRMVVATPHFYAERRSVSAFLERRQKAKKRLDEMLTEVRQEQPELQVPEIVLGAEVLHFTGMGRASQVRQLCMEGTNILLLEMPFCQWSEETLKEVRQLIKEQGLRIMIAHIDRYIEFQKKKDYYWELLELPVIVQANASAFLKMGSRRKILKLLEEEKVHVLGSDCHNLAGRAPNLQQAREVIEKKSGKEALLRIDQNGQQIIETIVT